MSVFDIIYTVLIGPLQLVFEIVFAMANRFIGHPGLAIIVLSLIMNFLVLPLYKRADAMQEAARDMDLKLQKGVKHIKKTFSGDERMMMLQVYYRQNDYKPTDALKGSVSLLLEIPFFMAAYQFLAHLSILDGVSLGVIRDLGAQDGLIHIGGMNINLLPILMTAINVISSTIYLKGFPVKTKVQLYAMSAFFLVFLYRSPAGLVFYWTLNNLFSLIKTIFYKLKKPRKVIGVLFSVLGLVILGYGLFMYENPSVRREIFVVALGMLFQLPLADYLFKGKFKPENKEKESNGDKNFFLCTMLLLTVLVGALIPTALLASSPQDFVNVNDFYNPLWYVAYSLCLSIGFFVVWMRVFYWLATPAGKAAFDKIVWIACGIMIINYMFFGTKLGVISANLQFENGLVFTSKEKIINIVVDVVIGIVMYLLVTKWKKALKGVLAIIVITIIGMSIMNVSDIHKSVSKVKVQADAIKAEQPHFALSKKGKNVIVLMLDRAMGEYVPYMFNEKPELREQFDGFTYYSNTLSHGGFTNFGTPGLFGGYEYTPVEMNKRDTESLVSKHNEALKVMPAIFYEEGYEVTVCDAPYANYEIVPDLSIYNDYPGMKTFITEGQFEEMTYDTSQDRNFFCYSIMKTLPVFSQDMVYNYGLYNQVDVTEELLYSTQVTQGVSVSTGVTALFMRPYNVLRNMSKITRITDDSRDTFLMMANNVTHEPMLLQEPSYEPSEYVDNTGYDLAHADRFTVNGITLYTNNAGQMAHYQTNMAAMIQIGNWLDYLRENDVYDNTRIIIVADHGRPLRQLSELILDPEGDMMFDAEFYYPLLMVKDFGAEGFKTSDEFMTNADVPTIALENLVNNPINPFTGKVINNDEKTAHVQYVTMSNAFRTTVHDPNTFLPATWFSVKDNIWNKDNWTYIDEVTTVPSGAR